MAKLYVPALERGEPGARYHASVEEGVTARAIAEAVGKGTGLPVRSVTADEVERYFGWMAPFAARRRQIAVMGAGHLAPSATPRCASA